MKPVSLMIDNVAAMWQWMDAHLLVALLAYVCCWPILEVLFYFRIQRFLQLRTAQRIIHYEDDTAEALRFWNVAIAEEDVEGTVRGWFVGDGTVRQENLMELIAWTLSGRRAADCEPTHRSLAKSVLDRLLRACRPNAFPTGYDDSLRCMTHTLEPLASSYKPLIFYLAHRAVHEVAGCGLRLFGFELRREGALVYWYWPGDGACPSMPVVVLHGVGGLAPYVPLLLQLRSMQACWPLIVPLLPHCAIRLPEHDPPPPLDTTVLVSELAAVVRRHSSSVGAAGAVNAANAATPPRAAFLAHSLGTAIFASLAKTYPKLVAASVLVDPICFLLYRKDIVHNFLYRQPKPLLHLSSCASLGYWFRLGLHYVLTLEPTIQSCFRREFWWTRHWLHPTDLRTPSLVVLSGQDAIVPAHAVHAYLTASRATTPATAPLDVEMHERAHHGALMVNLLAQRRLIGRLCELVDAVERPPHGAEAERTPATRRVNEDAREAAGMELLPVLYTRYPTLTSEQYAAVHQAALATHGQLPEQHGTLDQLVHGVLESPMLPLKPVFSRRRCSASGRNP